MRIGSIWLSFLPLLRIRRCLMKNVSIALYHHSSKWKLKTWTQLGDFGPGIPRNLFNNYQISYSWVVTEWKQIPPLCVDTQDGSRRKGGTDEYAAKSGLWLLAHVWTLEGRGYVGEALVQIHCDSRYLNWVIDIGGIGLQCRNLGAVVPEP